MRKAAMVLVVGVAAYLAMGVRDARAEDGFFSNLMQQATELVSPSHSADAAPRATQGKSIALKDGAVGVDTTTIATQVTIADDDTVVLKSDGSTDIAPEPEKKPEAPADNAPSMFDGVFDSLSFGGDAPAATTEAK